MSLKGNKYWQGNLRTCCVWTCFHISFSNKQKKTQQPLFVFFFLVGIHLICVINKLLNIFKLLFKHLSVLLLFAFSDQERYKKPTVIFYSIQPEGSGQNIPVLTFKGMLISWKSTGNLKYKISIVSVFIGDYSELLYLGPILAYELSTCTLNLSHFIFYTSVSFSETWQKQPCWFPVILSSLMSCLQGVLRCQCRCSCPKPGSGTRRNLSQILFNLCHNTRFTPLFQWGLGSNGIWKGWKTVNHQKLVSWIEIWWKNLYGNKGSWWIGKCFHLIQCENIDYIKKKIGRSSKL